MTAPDPASRYKALLGLAHQAEQEFRQQESVRAAKLGGELFEAGRAVEATTKHEAEVVREVTAWWSDVTAKLLRVSWAHPGPRPKPDPAGHPELLDDYLAEVLPKTEALFAALRRAVWPRKL